MTKHIVAWNFIDTLSDAQKLEHAQIITAELQALPALIDGLTELKVYTNLHDGSSRDLMLVSTHADKAALDTYQSHPAHLRAAGFVRAVTCDRICLDFEE